MCVFENLENASGLGKNIAEVKYITFIDHV